MRICFISGNEIGDLYFTVVRERNYSLEKEVTV
jgi:hypothetical protein